MRGSWPGRRATGIGALAGPASLHQIGKDTGQQAFAAQIKDLLATYRRTLETDRRFLLGRARRRIVYAADSLYAVVDAAVIVAAARG